jgi:hypothetical protein
MKYFAWFLFICSLVSCTDSKENFFEDNDIKLLISENKTIFPQKEFILEAFPKDTFMKVHNFRVKSIARFLQDLPVEKGSRKIKIIPNNNKAVDLIVISKDSTKSTSYYQLKTAEIIENFGYWKVEKID